MRIGFIGLGKMGYNMVLNLLESHEVVAYNRTRSKTEEIAKKGAIPAFSLQELVEKLPGKKIVWIMIKAGEPVDSVIQKLTPLLSEKDVIIDGGNSYYKDSLRRSTTLAQKQIDFLDVGTSGGVEGARHGACMMIGGKREIFNELEPIFKALCAEDGYGYMGKTGAGHFVKMVHNGIEYGMMAAIAQGMQLVKQSEFDSDMQEVAKVYANGSIIEGRLMKWLLQGMQKTDLESVLGKVPKGKTEDEMKTIEDKMSVLKAARVFRTQSRKNPSYAGKLIAVMRNQFGGHEINKA